MAGIIERGFLRKQFSEIKAEIEEENKSSIAADVNQLATGVLGQLNGIVSDKIREMWDLGLSAFRNVYQDSASGDYLEGVAEFTGITERADPQPAEGVLDMVPASKIVGITAGQRFRVGPTGQIVEALHPVSHAVDLNINLSVHVKSVDIGQGVSIAANSVSHYENGQTYYPYLLCEFGTTTGEGYNDLSACGGMTLSVIIDGGIEQIYTMPPGGISSAAALAADIQNELTDIVAGSGFDGLLGFRIWMRTNSEAGSIQVTGGNLNDILRFPTDLHKGLNSSAFTPGKPEETDEELRARISTKLVTEDKGNEESIQRAVLAIPGVFDCYVFSNSDEDTGTFIDGVAGRHYAVYIAHDRGSVGYQSVAGLISEAVWRTKGHGDSIGGLGGSSSGVIVDSQGFAQRVRIHPAHEEQLYLKYTISVDTDLFPAWGDILIRVLAEERGKLIKMGETAYASIFKELAFQVPGVLDVTQFDMEDSDPPSGENVELQSFRYRRFRVLYKNVDVVIV